MPGWCRSLYCSFLSSINLCFNHWTAGVDYCIWTHCHQPRRLGPRLSPQRAWDRAYQPHAIIPCVSLNVSEWGWCKIGLVVLIFSYPSWCYLVEKCFVHISLWLSIKKQFYPLCCNASCESWEGPGNDACVHLVGSPDPTLSPGGARGVGTSIARTGTQFGFAT